MRILHVIDYFQPRLGYQETFLALEQQRVGYDVTVLTGDRYRPFADYERQFRGVLGPRLRGAGAGVEEGIPTVRLPVRWESSGRAWMVGLERAVIRHRADAVHVHGIGTPTALRLGLALRWVRCGLVFDEHMLEVVVRRTLAGKAYYLLAPAVLRLALPSNAGLVAVSDETREWMAGRLHIPRNRIEVIPLGADDDAFAPDEPLREAKRRELGIAPEERLVLYTGKLVAEKGPDVLIAAVAHLRARENIRVLLVGPGGGPYTEAMRDRARKDGWADRLLVHDPVPSKSLRAFYNAADVCVWPRQASMSVFDAAACGRPVVVSDEPVGRERVAAGNGLTCREGDPEDLARALDVYLSDAGRALEAGRAGRRMIEEQYSWRVLSERFVDLYRRNQRQRSGLVD